MGKPKGRRGKSARRARQGQLGLMSNAGKKSKQFTKLTELREEKKDEKREIEALKEKVRGKLADEQAAKQPHSFVIHTGSVGRYVKRLERDMRRVMEPNTASHLKVSKRNNFKDFIVNAAPLGVSHLTVFTKTEEHINMRIMRLPQGPTVSFRVKNYSLARDILSSLKRPVIFQELFLNSPLVVLNGFNQPDAKHLNLVQSLIQNMFPSIHVDTLNLANIRRTVLVNYELETDTIEFRHYAIKTVPAGLSKSAKKIVQSRIPDLSKYEDISDYFLNPGALSESEYEEEQVEVDLPQDLKTRGCKKGQKTKIRLVEIGPRLTLQLTKIEEGIDEGEVLYHAFVKKSTKEIVALRRKLPLIRKRRLRHQKNVEHAVIRKLEARNKRLEKEEADFNIRKEALIRKQKQVTGDEELYSDEEKPPPISRQEEEEMESSDENDEPPNKVRKEERNEKSRRPKFRTSKNKS
uniref:Brix domain-containing protein n=1 Tax=Acrobeloides nanus TaxID=290746 RepID=A0A914DKM5_9BILA